MYLRRAPQSPLAPSIHQDGDQVWTQAAACSATRTLWLQLLGEKRAQNLGLGSRGQEREQVSSINCQALWHKIHRSWGLYPCSPLGLGAASGPARDDACAPHSRGPCRPQAPSYTGAPGTMAVFQAARVGSWVRDVGPHQPKALCKIPKLWRAEQSKQSRLQGGPRTQGRVTSTVRGVPGGRGQPSEALCPVSATSPRTF